MRISTARDASSDLTVPWHHRATHNTFSYSVVVKSSLVAVGSLLMGIFQTSLLAQATATARAKSMEEIEICDLFRRLDAFDGKRVAVRGIYRFSFELAGLYSEGCEKPLILDGAERAQALTTDFVGKSPEQQAQFAHFTEVVSDIAKGGGRQVIHVTFVGTLVTRNPRLHRFGQRKGERMFGHLGVFPAQLEVDGVKNIMIEDDGRKPSNMELPK